MTDNKEVKWPNQIPVVDGVVPFEEVPQDATLDDEELDLDKEMED